GCNPTSSKFIHTWLRLGEIMRGSLSALQALFYLPALISGIYITVTVALHKVSLTYRTCFQPATAFKQDRNVHYNLLRLI
ncbi:hypothetical protein ACJEKG_23120, partial [Escherichia coli]